jgi:MoxR-like ATPase
VVTPHDFVAMRQLVEETYVHPDVQRYIVNLVTKIRFHSQVAIGASPRGSLALLKLTRAWAAIQGRNYVLPDDVKLFSQNALCHRIILEPSLWGSKTTENTVIEEIVRSVAVPVIPFEHE